MGGYRASRFNYTPGFRSKTKVKNSEHKKIWDEVNKYENFLLSAEKFGDEVNKYGNFLLSAENSEMK